MSILNKNSYLINVFGLFKIKTRLICVQVTIYYRIEPTIYFEFNFEFTNEAEDNRK